MVALRRAIQREAGAGALGKQLIPGPSRLRMRKPVTPVVTVSSRSLSLAVRGLHFTGADKLEDSWPVRTARWLPLPTPTWIPATVMGQGRIVIPDGTAALTIIGVKCMQNIFAIAAERFWVLDGWKTEIGRNGGVFRWDRIRNILPSLGGGTERFR